MKYITTFFYFVVICITSFSQSPDIEWQNTIGGSSDDILINIEQTPDGGYILGGYSSSGISGDKTEISLGGYDYWIVKLNSFGEIIWQNSIGGNGTDILTSILHSTDGGFLLGGYSDSEISGDKTEASLVGSNDYWVVKVDSIGNLQWQNSIGGAGDDKLTSLCQSTDGGYILGGYSNSPISGDKTEASDEYKDYWVIKLDGLGNMIWENTIGGDEYDYLFAVVSLIFDNNVIIGGWSSSTISGDKTVSGYGTGGTGDFWILKLNNFGEIIWQKALGGDHADFLRSMVSSNNLELFGYSDSNISGDKTEDSKGYYDYWTVAIDSIGNIKRQKTIGGFNNEYASKCLIKTSNEYILGGYSLSGISGDKSEVNIGFEDYWIIDLDTLGNILWQKTIGGWLGDFLTGINPTSDGGFIVGGYSSSPISGNKTEDGIGANDYWIIKLTGDCTPLIFYHDFDNDGYGGNADSVLACLSPVEYVADHSDCDDANNFIYPGALEICNNTDDDCNTIIDEGVTFYTFYLDTDDDGFGNFFSDTVSCFLEIAGFVSDSTDCDDSNNLIHPGASEICNNTDDNCNIMIDEDLPFYTFYIDADNDIYGNALVDSTTCFTEITGYISDSIDCDDTDPNIYPGAEEILDSLDNNCNDRIDEGLVNIENSVNGNYMSIFPNPAYQNIYILFNSPLTISCELLLTDVNGRTLIKSYIYSNSLSEFDLEHFPSGIYFVKYIIDSSYFSVLFLKI